MKLETLEKLLSEASNEEYGGIDTLRADLNLRNALRNAAPALIEIARIAEQILITDLDGYNERLLTEALQKLEETQL